jgi:hypothetical protein
MPVNISVATIIKPMPASRLSSIAATLTRPSDRGIVQPVAGRVRGKSEIKN